MSPRKVHECAYAMHAGGGGYECRCSFMHQCDRCNEERDEHVFYAGFDRGLKCLWTAGYFTSRYSWDYEVVRAR